MKSIYLVLIALIFNVHCANAQSISFNADITSGCAPLTVHFTNTSSYGQNAVYYWTFGEGQGISSFHADFTFQIANSHFVTLYAYDTNNSQFLGRYDMYIQVNGSSSSFQVSTGLQVCPGQQVNFSSYDQVMWCKWYFGDGDSADWSNTSHTYNAQGTYQVMLIENTSCGTDTIIQVITVSSSAVYPVQINTMGGNSFCPGELVSFSNGYPAVSYFWDFGDGSYSIASQPQHQYPDTGFYNVILKATNMCGNSNYDTITIQIQNNLQALANTGIWPNNLCPGEFISYYTWSSGQFEWDFGDGFVSSLANGIHAFTDTGNYNVRFIVTNACGDADTSYQLVTVGYHPVNPPSAYIQFNNFSNWENDHPVDTLMLCPNTQVIFDNYSWGSSGNSTFFWDFGDGVTSTERNTSHTFAQTGMNTVMMIVTDPCGASDTAFKWILINPGMMPQASLQALPTSVCAGENVYFFDDGNKNGNEGYTYSIWFGDGTSVLNLTTSTDTVLHTMASHIYTGLGNYNYTFVVTNQCGNSDSITGIISVSSNPLPFYYIDNSTNINNLGNMPDFGQPSGPDDHQFLFPVNFPQWVQGMNDDFFVVFWYGHQDMNNLGQPDGILTLQGLGTAHAYVPVQSDSITILGAWSCNGMLGNGDPDAIGILGYFPLTLNGFTDIPEPGLVLSNWDGTCDTVQPQNPNAACVGDEVEFVIVGGQSYEWHFGDGATSVLQAATHAYTLNGVYDAFCVVTTGCGTVDTLHTTVTVAGYNMPQPANICIDQGGWGCANTPIQFWSCNNNYNNSNTDTYTYLWNFGDGTTSTQRDPVHQYSGGGQYTVSLVVSNGCGSSMANSILNVNEPQVTAIVSNGCSGSDNGFIELLNNNSWGTTYQWSNGASTANISGLAPGLYAVTVSEQNGCFLHASFTIDNILPVQVNAVVAGISCNGMNDGSIDLSVTGGNYPYHFYWSDNQVSEDLSGLTEGIYAVTVVDANACHITQSGLVITNPDILGATLTAADLLCYGAQTGNINTAVTGGTAPYEFIWSHNSMVQNPGSLAAGNYTVTITDAHGCSVIGSESILQPSEVVVSYGSAVQPTCTQSDGSLDISVTGGTPGYTYLWSDISSQTSQDPSGLPAGVYVVTVTDANNCEVFASFALTDVNAPDIALAIAHATCFGSQDGTVEATVTGGSPAYVYSWSTSGTANTISGIGAGLYSITVTDQAGCIATEIALVNEPDSIQIVFTVQDVLCFGASNGSIISSTTGGTSPYTYLWSNFASGTVIASLAPGTYTLTVTDNNLCTNNASVVISEPADIIAAINLLSPVLCHGANQGTANVTATGGILPYTYHWSNQAVTQNVSGLGAGTIVVTVTDANGCSASQTTEITEPSVITVSITGYQISCHGNADGVASATASGGTGVLDYSWSTGSNAPNIFSLQPGAYSLSVSDENNCTVEETVTITQPDPVYVSEIITDASSATAADGAVDLSVTGGTQPYEYYWNNGSYAEDLVNVPAGNYTCVVSDANGCHVIDTVFVNFTVSAGLTGKLIIKLYPNPTTGMVQVFNAENFRVEVFNIVGNKLIDTDADSYITMIDLKPYPDGVYFVRLTKGDNSVMRKIVLNK